jgi:hypothetical protein
VVDSGKELRLCPVRVTLAVGQRLSCFAALLFGGVALLDDAAILRLELACAQQCLLGLLALSDVADDAE